jgi:hypothetical protein
MYQYNGREERTVPRYRDDDFVQEILSIASAKRPVLSHKFPPLISNWPDFCWYRVMCTAEPMHDIKNTCDRHVRLLVGKVSNTGYSSWNKDVKHREHCKRLNIFPELWPERAGPLHWRLTKPQRLLLDERMKNVVWPHYLEPLCYGGESFWLKPGRMWKARRKLRLMLFILPTQLRDQVPMFRDALFLFYYQLRRLLGQVSSFDYAVNVLGILPGSVYVVKSLLPAIDEQLQRGLSLIEGCTPIDDIRPVEHHFCHYPKLTGTHGPLVALWMYGFERYNKFLKNHVHNNQHPVINLAHTTTRSDTAFFFKLSEEDVYDLPSQLHHRYSFVVECVSITTTI